ncbi:MAG TPA: protein phosphatase 2C domain-containing protein [Polyangiaceae bacterium]
MNSQTLPLQPPQSAGPRPDPHTTWDAGGYTHTGQRRQANEDSFLVATFQRALNVIDSSHLGEHPEFTAERTRGTLLMVADGMGGHGGGDVASRAAVRAVTDYLVHVLPCASAMSATLSSDARTSLHGVRAKLASALLIGDEAIRTQANAGSGEAQMGTTLTLAVITGPMLYVAHVGDSRCYLLRGGALHQLTSDHTVANQIASLGGNVSDAAQLNHILWNCLGGGEGTFPQPEVLKHELEPGDAVFLCTDGLTNELDDETILALLTRSGSSRDICAGLVGRANEHGGQDNITAVLAKPGVAARGRQRRVRPG